MSAGRFDNLSGDDLLAHHADLLKEREDLEAEIKRRMLAACPVKIGKVYRIKRKAKHPDFSYLDALGGRWIWVRHLKPQFSYGRWKFVVEGPLKRPTKSPTRNGHAGGIYTSRFSDVLLGSIDVETEQDPPT